MAISFDAVANGTSATTSLSFSHVCTGSNLVLLVSIVAVQATDGTINPTVTYNGISMTLLGKNTPGATLRNLFVFYLLNPSTGSNSVSITLNGTGAVNKNEAVSVSYAGVKQTGFPDSQNAGNDNPSAFAAWNTSTTVISSGCWLVNSVNARSSSINQTGGASRGLIDSSTLGVGDSNGTVGTGSQTISFTAGSGSPVYDWIIWSMAPAQSANTNFFAMFN